MSTYRQADKEVEHLATGLLKYYYPALVLVEVSIEYLFAHAKIDEQTGEAQGPAIKHQGWPACATVKINSLKDRAAGCRDARIVVDGDEWPHWSKERRLAILHHELHHLELKLDDEGQVRSDDLGRPLLKLKPHDFQMGGFYQIVKLHWAQAVEGQAVALAARELRQLDFDWDKAELLAAGRKSLAGV